eukprot:4666396-Pleurochrysis_carterae.AAC.1
MAIVDDSRGYAVSASFSHALFTSSSPQGGTDTHEGAVRQLVPVSKSSSASSAGGVGSSPSPSSLEASEPSARLSFAVRTIYGGRPLGMLNAASALVRAASLHTTDGHIRQMRTEIAADLARRLERAPSESEVFEESWRKCEEAARAQGVPAAVLAACGRAKEPSATAAMAASEGKGGDVGAGAGAEASVGDKVGNTSLRVMAVTATKPASSGSGHVDGGDAIAEPCDGRLVALRLTLTLPTSLPASA